MVDPKIIRRLSAQTGLGTKMISKEDKISVLLDAISHWDNVDMVLKGGTALNRVFLEDNFRFSEDIDMDLFGKGSMDDKIKSIKQNLKSLSDQFTIEGPRILGPTIRFDAYYINEFEDKDRVMLDINIAFNEPLIGGAIEKKLVASKLIQTSPSILPVYSFEDLIAQKLIALNNRSEGKDIYDLFFTLDKKIDKEILFKTLDLRSKEDHSHFLHTLHSRKDEFISKSIRIRDETNHYIPRNRRPHWEMMILGLFEKIELLLN